MTISTAVASPESPQRRWSPVHGRRSPTGRTWLDYDLDITGCGRSDAPRLPAKQVDRLFPDGAPPSWGLLIQEPRRPAWLLRTVSALVSVAIGAVALLSPALAGVVATIGAGVVEMVSIAGHLLGLVGAGGWLGLVGRLATVLAVSVSLGRLGWRAARWGVAPIGDDR